MRQRKNSEACDPARVENPDIVALARRVATLRGFHRTCSEAACRRARRCAGPEVGCLRERSGRPVPIRVIARRLAAIRRAAKAEEAEAQQ